MFVLNLSQSLGAMPVNVGKISVDAVVSAGYKWLWSVRHGLLLDQTFAAKTLTLNHAYWARCFPKTTCWRNVL